METVRRILGGKRVEFPVYTIEEADDLGLDAVPWRECDTEGWGITDDGYVTECLYCREYPSGGRPNIYWKFTAGTCWNRTPEFLFEKCRDNHNYAHAGHENWVVTKTNQERGKATIALAAAQKLARGRYDYEQLAKAFDPYSARTLAYFSTRKFLRQTYVKQRIQAKMADLISEKGATLESWVELGNELFKEAKAAGDVAEMRRIWKDLGEFIDVKSKLKTSTGSGTLGRITEELDQQEVKDE